MGSIISTGSEQPLPEPSQESVEDPVPAPTPAEIAPEPVFSAEHAFQIGARVQARWAGKWFDAIVKAHPRTGVAGVYEVDWLETPRVGNSVANTGVRPATDVRAPEPEPEPAPAEPPLLRMTPFEPAVALRGLQVAARTELLACLDLEDCLLLSQTSSRLLDDVCASLTSLHLARNEVGHPSVASAARHRFLRFCGPNDQRQAYYQQVYRQRRVAVAHIVRRARNLREIGVHGEWIDDDILRTIAASCPQLQTCWVDCCHVDSVEPLAACTRLERVILDYTSCGGFTPLKFMNFVRCCSTLTSVTIERSDGWIGDGAVIALAESCPGLRELNLDWGLPRMIEDREGLWRYSYEEIRAGAAPPRLELLTDRAFVALAENCPRLEAIRGDCLPIGDTGLAAIMRRCSNFRVLLLGDGGGLSAGLVIHTLTGVTTTRLEDNYFGKPDPRDVIKETGNSGRTALPMRTGPDDTLLLSNKQPHQDRQVQHDGKLTDGPTLFDALVALPRPSLRKFACELLALQPTSGPGAGRIADLPSFFRLHTQLVAVQLRAGPRDGPLRGDGFRDDDVLAIAEHCPALQHFSLDYATAVTDVGVAALATNCRQLTILELKFCHGVTDESVRALASTGLEALTLLGSNNTDATSQLFAGINGYFGGLRELRLLASLVTWRCASALRGRQDLMVEHLERDPTRPVWPTTWYHNGFHNRKISTYNRDPDRDRPPMADVFFIEEPTYWNEERYDR